jgi:hypothetical protein
MTIGYWIDDSNRSHLLVDEQSALDLSEEDVERLVVERAEQQGFDTNHGKIRLVRVGCH